MEKCAAQAKRIGRVGAQDHQDWCKYHNTWTFDCMASLTESLRSKMRKQQAVEKLEDVILLVDDAIGNIRLASIDQNPKGWRDILGAAAGKIRRER